MLTMLSLTPCKFAYMRKNLDTTGDRIRRCRIEAGLTQKQLGQLSGVSAAAVAQWESGDTKTLRPANLFKVARVLKKSAEWFITGSGEEQAGPDLNKILNALPQDTQQLVLDLIEYRIDRAEAHIAADKTGEYTALVKEFKRDLENRRHRDSSDRGNSSKSRS